MVKDGLRRLEEAAAGLVLVAMALLPVVEIVLRMFESGIPGSGPIVRHLTLWVAFLGAMLAAREGKLLAIATGEFLPDGRFKRSARAITGFVSATICVMLARASWALVLVDKEFETKFGPDLPVWVAQLVMPIGFAVIGLRIVWRSGHWRSRVFAAAGLALGWWLADHPEIIEEGPLWPWIAGLLFSTALGGPLFVVIGGAAIFCFLNDGTTMVSVPVESFGMAVKPHLPAIPLFTFAGFLLSEGKVAERLLRLFRAWFGWMPGGTAIVCATLCAFLTVFTGGSGVTILIVGGLLLTALKNDGYRDRFSVGLLTASGSLGLLLPPALPLILYGIVAEVPVEDLFIGGILPGLLLVALIAAWGVREGIRGKTERVPFEWKEALLASRGAIGEMLLPVVVLVVLFGGFATLVETSAVTVLYAFLLQVVVHRDLGLGRDFFKVVRECSVLTGGVLIILAVAMGFTSWLVDAEIPAQLVEYAQTHIESKLLFLIALNVFLLLVGCVMDIFSATIVVVPLIVPLGVAFGIDPVHLGIIFIANLELGYLTPPVGLNLFLASYRFERPLLEVYKSALPMLCILGIGVLVITYVPWLTLFLVELLGEGS